MMYVVLNELRDAINDKLDKALEGFPECSEKDREILYHQLLDYYNEHGVVPDFKLEKKEEPKQ